MEEHSRNVYFYYDYIPPSMNIFSGDLLEQMLKLLMFQTVTSQYRAISHEQPGDNKHLFMHTTGSKHYQVVELSSAQ